MGPAIAAIGALRARTLTVDFLMILAALGAAAIGDLLEGAVLLFLFSLSGALEAFAMDRTTRSIDALINLRPNDALQILPDLPAGRLVPVDSLQVGDMVRVKPGERFPIDGVVAEGETWADESTLTGESIPVHKRIGAIVFAGTFNVQGSVVARMTKAVADTTLQRIIGMVQTAQAQKTPTQRFIESWQRPYVLGVLSAAGAVLVGARFLHTQNWHDALYHAMVLLVAASPCAVVIGSPAVMLSGIARAARHGILFKGAVYLERLGTIDVIAFDKTGTLTSGKPAVAEIWAAPGTTTNRILGLAAAVERYSEHPLAAAVFREAERRGVEVLTDAVTEFQSRTGLGVSARVKGQWVGVGREQLFRSHGVSIPSELCERARKLQDAGQTVLLIISGEANLYGCIGLADQKRPKAVATIAALKKLGVRKTVLLTGDHERVGRSIAAELAVDEFHAGLLPDQKVAKLRQLARGGDDVAMVGDGVNDAPALATAAVGIAMGGAGSDVALETADVVLMRDELDALPLAVAISRTAGKRVRQNMIFAFAMIAMLVLATFFELPLWLGVLGHEGSTVLVVFNGLRLLWERLPAAG